MGNGGCVALSLPEFEKRGRGRLEAVDLDGDEGRKWRGDVRCGETTVSGGWFHRTRWEERKKMESGWWCDASGAEIRSYKNRSGLDMSMGLGLG
ncbi:hypothetical protein HAX54_017332 [Datura stramonium]|uniref:Uncharacterized protein n=1 Tax=Datura stramonium TaxID=4076 RepID=A0ABS8UM13_DATST|nr:hypothetical protein [Datura stramonium]